VYTGIWLGNLSERGHLEDRGVDGKVILKWIFRKAGWGGIYGINLTQDMDRWRAILNVVMSFRVPKNAGNFLTSREPISFSRRTLLNGVSRYRITVILNIFCIVRKFLTEL